MLLDNKNSGYVGNELKKRSFEESKLSVLSSLFTLYGFASLKKELSKLQETRLFLTDWQSELGLQSEDHFYAQELFKQEELKGYLKNTLETQKSVYTHVVYDSGGVEKTFAEDLSRQKAAHGGTTFAILRARKSNAAKNTLMK